MSSGTPDRKPKPVTPPVNLPPLRPPSPKPPVRPVITPTAMPVQTPAEPPVEHTLPALPSMMRAAVHPPTLSNADGPTPPPLPAMFSEPPPLPENPPPLPVAPLPPLSELQPWSAFSIGPAAAPPPPSDDLDLSLDDLEDLIPPPLPAPSPEDEAKLGPAAEAKPAAGAKTAPTMSELGQVGPYILKQLIGEGGMGLVYKAEDARLKRPVALKVMKPEIAADERAFKLFITEAQAMAALKDDRIATVYQADEDHGRVYMAMELLKGESLESRLKRGPVSLEQALWIVREAALGLKVAHNSGFVHRDIKPANLWLETAGAKPQVDQLQRFRPGEAGAGREWQYLRVKILDFGLVRLEQDSDGKRKTSIVGTPAYMAPEQAAGKEADHLADVFSLGVVLFRLLTGRLPFDGETSMEVITALATKTAPLVSDFNPDAPKSLVELVQRMLSRDPMGRPNSMADVARWLEGIEKFVLAPPPPPKKNRRTMMITAGVVVAMVLAAVATVWWGMQGGSSDDVPVVAAAPSNKVLAPVEAVNAIGDKVTVEFIVGAWRREDGQVYLYEQQPPKTDELFFRVALPGHIVTTMRRKSGSPWPAAVEGARIRVQGTVLREGRFAELLVSDIEQFDKILYKERSEPAAKPKAGEKEKSAAKSKAGEKPSELPGSIGGDLPGTDGPTRRQPDKQTSEELKDSVKKAARDMLKGFMDKDGQGKK